MSNINDIIKSGDLNLIATLMVAVAFGWRASTQEETVAVEEEIPFVLTEQDEEIPGLTTITTTDHEVEQEYIRTAYVQDEHGFPVPMLVTETDDGATVDQPYFTRSGDNPVILDMAAQADMDRSAAGFMTEELADLPGAPYTSVSRYGKGKVQARNVHTILTFLVAHEDSNQMLVKGHKRFWKRVMEQENHSFLFPKQVAMIRGEFEKRGVFTKKRQAELKA